jgi:protein N-terminal methyltransferase
MPPVFKGVDDSGNSIGTNVSFWKAVAAGSKDASGKPLWYKKGIDYWDTVDATDDGVLGGYGHVSSVDAKENAEFLRDTLGDVLEQRRAGTRGPLVACDCGAGIGRVTSSFLIHEFDEVDLVEPVRHFIDKAEALLGAGAPARADGHVVKNFFAVPLEGFEPEPERYDAVWIQWCVGHLTDDDFVSFFKRCASGLKKDGLIFVKENNAKDGFVLDTEDSSLTRSHKYFMHLFEDRLGWEVVKHRMQKDFPQELFKVRMYAVKPIKRAE